MARVIQYATPGQVDAVAYQIEPRWLNLSDKQKELYCTYATQDIEKYHGLPRDSSGRIPALYGGPAIQEGAIYQSLFVMRTVGIREWSERANKASNGQFDDSIISRETSDGVDMDDTAKGLVDVELKNNGVENSAVCTFERG